MVKAMLMKDKCVCLVLKLVNEFLQVTLFVLDDSAEPLLE